MTKEKNNTKPSAINYVGQIIAVDNFDCSKIMEKQSKRDWLLCRPRKFGFTVKAIIAITGVEMYLGDKIDCKGIGIVFLVEKVITQGRRRYAIVSGENAEQAYYTHELLGVSFTVIKSFKA